MWLVFIEALTGLFLLALLITYLSSIYTAFSRRELGVTALSVRAGEPPSGREMIWRHWVLERIDELQTVWVEWELWFVDVEETHTSLPALVFLRSPQPDPSWVTASGAVLDGAALTLSSVDVPRDVEAVFMIRAGYLCLRRIADFFQIPYDPTPSPGDPISVAREEWEATIVTLEEAGVPLKADREQAGCCIASSPPPSRRTMSTDGRRSCSSPGKSWSAGLAGARVPVIVGPTAVGKTAVALALAAHLPIEVVSADSRQVYRRLDIGTAKATRRERKRLPHHGVDLIEPGERYSAGRFAVEAAGWVTGIRERARLPVVVGGTGLYVRALADGLFREPPLDPARRTELAAWAAALPGPDLVGWAARLDPDIGKTGNKERRQGETETRRLFNCGTWIGDFGIDNPKLATRNTQRRMNPTSSTSPMNPSNPMNSTNSSHPTNLTNCSTGALHNSSTYRR